MEEISLSPIMHPTLSAFDEDPSSPVLDASHNYDPCMKALLKPPSERKTEDIELIAESLKSFKHLLNSSASSSDPERVFHDLSKKAMYKRFPASSSIFHKGDTDDKIFFVLQGTAIIFNEIASEVFKPQAIMVPEEVKAEKSPDEPRPKQLLLREMSLDEPSKALFQPKMTKKFLRQFTSVGDVTTPNPNNTSIRVVPTVHELKKTINESHSAIDIHPLEHDFSGQLEHAANGNGRLVSPDSPTRAERETKRKIVLYKLLLKADKERPGKYVKDGQFLYQYKKRVVAGMHFGEIASRNAKVRSTTAVALEDLHVISIRADDYLSALSHQVSNVNNNLRFLEPFFSDASYPKLVKLLDLFEECEYPQRHKIFEEETPVDALYLIKEGEIQLLKSLDTSKYTIKDEKAVPSNIRKKCFIATLGKGEALGDEDFFFGDKRNYTGIVTSVKTVLLRLSKQVYNEISELYRELFDGLKKTAKAKMQFKKEQVKNITHQVVQSAQHIEGLKKSFTKLIKQPTIKFTEGKDPVFYLQGDQQGSPLRQRSLSGSPANKMLTDSPTIGRIDSFGEVATKMATSPSKQHLPSSKPLLTVTTSSSHPKSLLQSPMMRSPEISPKNTFYEKKSSELHLVPKPVKTQPERPRSQAREVIVVRQPSRSGVQPIPMLEGSSLYKEALGHVRRRKPISMKRESRGPMNHKLYMGELEKSVQMFTKNNGSRNDLSGNSGYVSVATSPGTKLHNDKNGGILWDTMFGKEDEDTKLMATALVREKVNSRVEHDLVEKYRLSKGYSVKNNSISQKLNRMDQSQQSPLIHVRSQELSFQNNKSSSPLVPVQRRLDSANNNKFQESKSVLYKRNSQPKFDDLIATLEPESFDAEPVRTGFKPSKVLTMKIQFRATMNHKIKGKKFWEVK